MKLAKIIILFIVLLVVAPRLCTYLLIKDNINQWVFSRHEDKLRNNQYSTASIKSINNTASLNIRCNEGVKKVDFFIVFKTYLNSREEINVLYKFDNENSVWEQWSPSSEGDTVFAKNDKEKVLDTLKASSFIIEAENFNGVRYTEEFNLQKDKTELKKVLKACGMLEN